MQRREGLSQLPEQEVAKYTRDRIEGLAKQSGFNFVTDYTGISNVSYLPRNYLSLYRSPADDKIVAAFFSEPVGPTLLNGSITFSPVMPDPFDAAHFIQAGTRERYFFLTDGAEKTRFVDYDVFRENPDFEFMYPDLAMSDIVMEATDQPEDFIKLFKPSIGEANSQDKYTEKTSQERDVLSAVRKHNEEEGLNAPLRNRSHLEAEEWRAKLIVVNRRLGSVNIQRDLIPPPRRG